MSKDRAVRRFRGAQNLTVRLKDEIAADAEALTRVEGKSLNETVQQALVEAVEHRLAQLVIAVVFLITAKLIDWRDRWDR